MLHHSFIRNFPLYSGESWYQNEINISWFWLEVCEKDKLKEKTSKQNEAFICIRKLFLKKQQISMFSYFVISKLWRAVSDSEEEKPGQPKRKKKLALFIFSNWAVTWKKLILSLLPGKS